MIVIIGPYSIRVRFPKSFRRHSELTILGCAPEFFFCVAAFCRRHPPFFFVFGFICDSPVPLGTLYYRFNFDGQQTRAGALGSQGTHSAFAGVPFDTSMIGLEMHIDMVGLDWIAYCMI